MLEYAKIILPKVCEWKSLFKKELKKSYNWMPENELPELYRWCYSNFQQLYPDVLAEIFKDSAWKQEIEAIKPITENSIDRKYSILANSA